MQIFEKINSQLEQNLPFVVYKKPNGNELIGFFQKNNDLYYTKTFEESGFIFAPFEGEKTVIFPEDQCEILIEMLGFENKESIDFNKISDGIENKANHLKLIQKGIEAIKNKQFEKVVLARKEIQECGEIDLNYLFQKMVENHKNAFCYYVYHPKIGLWMGAFFEQLLKIQNNMFETFSLAGTQLFQDEKAVTWQKKEQEEQQIVTDFIINQITTELTNTTVSGPITVRSGEILHLKTKIEGQLKREFNLKKIINSLHPTPAVCGFPKTVAQKFLLENENFDREYYAGYLGELNSKFRNFETHLFVNLRCMKIEKNSSGQFEKVHFFAGGGITKDSIAENEWAETVQKMQTMKTLFE